MYAYPQRPGAVAGPPATAFSQPPPQMTPQQQAPQVYVPPPPPVVMPGLGLYTMASGSVTTLRLKLADEIRIEPPIAVSAALLPSSGAQAAPGPDLSLERQLVEGGPDGKGAAGVSCADVDAYLAGMKPGDVPQDPAIKQLAASGKSGAAAALGVVYGRLGRGGAEQAADFASKCEQLTNMGFSLAMAGGALAKHKVDVEAATESCLATAS